MMHVSSHSKFLQAYVARVVRIDKGLRKRFVAFGVAAHSLVAIVG